MKAYIIYKHIYNNDLSGLIVGGIETYLVNLCKVFQARNIQPIIVQCANKTFVKEDNGILFLGFELSSMKNWAGLLYDKIQYSLTEEDLLIWGTDTFSRKIKHKRSLAIQHGIDFDYYPEEELIRKKLLDFGLGGIYKYFQRRRALKSFRKSAIKICVDYNFWNWYRTFCIPREENNIYVIPNFAHNKEVETQLADSYSRTEGPLKILFARRFVRRRGLDVMLEVASHFESDTRFTFTFAGEGPGISKIQSLQLKQKNIFTTSYKANESIAFHSQFDVAIIPTIGSEGTSFSLLEAMSAGLSVICTSVGGMTNIVLDKFNGLLVRPQSSQDIINYLELLYKDPDLRAKLALNAQNTVQESFSFKNWCNRWNQVIDRILEL